MEIYDKLKKQVSWVMRSLVAVYIVGILLVLLRSLNMI